MTTIEEIAKSLQDIEKKIVLMGASHEEVLIQKVADGAKKRLLYILLIFLAGVALAGSVVYNHFVTAVRSEIIKKFNEEELPKIKEDISTTVSAVVSKEAMDELPDIINNLPEIQSKIESIMNSQLELARKSYDSKFDALIEELKQKGMVNENITDNIKQSIEESDRSEAKSLREGWSFYGLLEKGNWKVRYFDISSSSDMNSIPSKDTQVLSKQRVNIRKNIPSYSEKTGWNYTQAGIIGTISEAEKMKVTEAKTTETLNRGTYVWIQLSPVQQ